MGRALKGRGLRLSWTLAALLVLVVAGGPLAWSALGAAMQRPGANPSALRVQVTPGMSLRAVLLRLQRDGVLQHPRWVELYLRLHAQMPRIQAGLYEVPRTPRRGRSWRSWPPGGCC